MMKCWVDIPGYSDFINAKWKNMNFFGWSGFILKEKLKLIKYELKSWHQNHTANIDSKIQVATNRLEDLDCARENRALDNNEELEARLLPSEIMGLSKIQASASWQKSRFTWLQEGDANTKFFHGIMSARRRGNSIVSFEVDGNRIEGVAEVRHLIFDHFRQHFQKKLHARPDISNMSFKSVSEQDRIDLVKPFLLDEIKTVVWECDSFKSPGPDGGVLSKGLNSTFIALIPKVECPQRVADFRPIALTQSAFIKGRQILDGVLIANEIVDDAKRSKKELLMFKVDFEKAYDSMDWEYLDEVMFKMQFLSRWRGWIMEFVSSASASVLVNGCPTDEFTLERGLRQGDPLSPFLYLLAAEGLHVMMDAAVSNHLYSPYSIGNHNEVIVSHLQFADDTLLVGTKSWANIRILKAVLSLYENVSGLKINFHKSMLFGVNVNDSWLHEVASVLRCKHGRLPFLYLGLPIGGDARKLQFWYPLVDKIRNRLSGWKRKHLSMGGRLILLKSVLSSMPVYFLSFFKAPAGKWIWRILEEKDSLWKQVLTGVGLLDPRWLVDNIVRKVGDGRNTLFWKDNWLDDGPVERSFSRLYALAENKLVTVADMCDLGWGPNGEGWRWRRGLRAWEEDLVKECITRLSNVFMQVTEQDKWVWKLHPSSCYNVKSAYSYLTESDVHLNEDYNRFMRVKSLPLKVNLLMWRLFLNKLPTKDNLLRRGILDGSGILCDTLCGKEENVDHLFFQCEHYGKIWALISGWLGFVTAFQGTLSSHSTQFCGMGGLSKSCHILLTTIWAATLFIIWKDRNSRVFKAKHATIEVLVEHIKLQSYWWLKANYVLFDFDYSFWHNNPFNCRQAFV
ncbi:hypothetical protein TSUD_272340 [Trifolium subterraneum]|uniref:Reverse transcriptase domain-containing protein n=1 Tax=Trifolium subterraneum TaxID=3900 RepID=A0A2Z6PMM4_TRISU|nr:hypothetical protein TSUD_272340 [Trifolium subterraneum]